MKRLRRIIACTFLIVLSSKMMAQESGEKKFSYDLELRPRTEYRDGYKSLKTATSEPVLMTTQRSRLGVSFQNDRISSRLSFQDVRAWGEDKTKSDVATIDVHEAWMEFLVATNISLKAGRQQLKYEDQRLLAGTNWNNIGSSHDLLLAKYGNDGLDAHLGLAYNNDKEKNFESLYPVAFYKTMQFLYLSKTFGNGLRLSLLEIADGNEDAATSTINYRKTAGLNLEYGPDDSNLLLFANGYYQGGKTTAGNPINAYFFSARADYTMGKLSLAAGTDYFSGNNTLDTLDTENNAFNKLYGAGHKHLGYMDYFTSVESQTNGAGLQDIYAIISAKVSDKLSCSLAYHHFSVTGQLLDPNSPLGTMQAVDRGLGSEFDLTVNYKYSSDLDIQAGYSNMFATPSMEVLKGGDSGKYAHWFYVMLTYKIKS